MMKELKKLSSWDFPDTVLVAESYGMEKVPEATKENMSFLVDKYNELVDAINILFLTGDE